jgi:hypothetical protein
MPVATTSNIRIISSWTTGDVSSKRNKVLSVELHDPTDSDLVWGTVASKLSASAFGLRYIEKVSATSVTPAANAAWFLARLSDGSGIIAIDPSTAGFGPPVTDAGASPTPNGWYFTVEGY